MTYRNLETKLNTHATTAGISTYIYGYLDEVAADTREGVYPCMVINPISRPLKTRTKDDWVLADVDVYIMNSWKREDTTTRTQVWDGIDTKMLAFVAAVNASNDFTVLNVGAVDSEVYPFGLNVDSVVAIKYTLKLKIWC